MNLQSFLFDQQPNRRQLMDYTAQEIKEYKVFVYRNHSFELIDHTIAPYLDYAHIGIEFSYSGYDDSLSFVDLPENSDMMILWLDMKRYTHSNIEQFISDRLDALCRIYTKPILFIPLDWNGSVDNPRISLYTMDEILSSLGEKAFDIRMEPYTGTRLSQAALTQISRQLGLQVLPSMIYPPLKAVIVDLDNTLYQGVLGEEKPQGLVLTEGHFHLQQKLHDLGEQGFFICAASKNDPRDVEELFRVREDFPLKRQDFTKMAVSWNPKAQAISELAAALNIGIDSMLFIDDNSGEINAVMNAHPQIYTLLAYEDGEKTLRVLNEYPRMKKSSISQEDKLRKTDIQANEARKNLRESLSVEEYLKSIEVNLAFAINDPDQKQRVSELAQKTNQFIFNYKRYSVADIEEIISDPECAVITVTLSDRLSDSGIIGVACARYIKEQKIIRIEECFVSCRALGRGLEDSIVLGMIEAACRHFECRHVSVLFRKGERNVPAEQYLQKQFSKTENIEVQDFVYRFPEDIIHYEIKEKKP